MTNIRRYYKKGQVYFLTHITHRRLPILVANSDLLIDAFDLVESPTRAPLIAWAILPDHCHMLVDPRDLNLSLLMRRMKLSFSAKYRQRTGRPSGRVWQNRFWDHVIRDQEDMNRHLDYIHYNPVKHGLVPSPFQWDWSSASRFLDQGYYQRDWGAAGTLEFDGEFGE